MHDREWRPGNAQPVDIGPPEQQPHFGSGSHIVPPGGQAEGAAADARRRVWPAKWLRAGGRTRGTSAGVATEEAKDEFMKWKQCSGHVVEFKVHVGCSLNGSKLVGFMQLRIAVKYVGQQF